MKTRALALFVLLLLAVPVFAQTAPLKPLSPDRLPADTWALFVWHGSASMDKVRATNALLRLWDDPALKPVRDHLTQQFYDEMEKDPKVGEEKLTRGDLDDIISLLENPVVFGFTGDLVNGTMSGKTPGFFVAFNRTGKAAIIERLNKKESAKPNTEKSRYTFQGVEVRKSVTTTPPDPAPAKEPAEGEEAAEQEPEPPAEPKVTMNFEATVGDHELMSNEQAVIESLITRLQASAPPLDSLAANKRFQAAQKFRADGTMLEGLVLVPDFSGVPIPPSERFDAGAAIRELHVERLHAITISLGLLADKSLTRGAFLGDTAPGSLFDMIAADTAEFRTPAVAPANSSFAAIRLDLLALYATLQRAARAGLPPEQAAMADMVDGMVAMQTGMPLTQILGLFTGEIGMISTGDAQMAEALPNTIAIAVNDSEPVMGLLRTMLGPMITGEEPVTGATLLTLTPPPGPPAEDGTPPKEAKPYFVAVAPKMLIVSQSRAELDASLGLLASGAPAPAGSMAADPGFQKARKAMPEKVSGLTYGDYTTFPWDKQRDAMKKQFAEQKSKLLAQADAAEKGSVEVEPDPDRAAALRKEAAQLDKVAEFADVIFPLLKKYLHTSAAFWRKSLDGVFMEGYVN